MTEGQRNSLAKIVDKLEPKVRPSLATPVPREVQPSDLPRAGAISSQIFNELTQKVLHELNDTVQSQITDAANRRLHAKTSMDMLAAEIDKAFEEFAKRVEELKAKIDLIASAVKDKVEEDTREMIGLSERLEKFADTVNEAHKSFFVTE